MALTKRQVWASWADSGPQPARPTEVLGWLLCHCLWQRKDKDQTDIGTLGGMCYSNAVSWSWEDNGQNCPLIRSLRGQASEQGRDKHRCPLCLICPLRFFQLHVGGEREGEERRKGRSKRRKGRRREGEKEEEEEEEEEERDG